MNVLLDTNDKTLLKNKIKTNCFQKISKKQKQDHGNFKKIKIGLNYQKKLIH